jgi:hypothetical protein
MSNVINPFKVTKRRENLGAASEYHPLSRLADAGPTSGNVVEVMQTTLPFPCTGLHLRQNLIRTP